MDKNNLIPAKSASLYAKAKSSKDGLPPRISRSIVFVVFTMLVSLGWWASVTEIREISRSSGEIAPTGPLVSVQHATGGVIQSVFKASGDVVKKGEPVAQLSSVRLKTELDQLSIRAKKLREDVHRYRSLLDEIPTDVSLPVGPGQNFEFVQLAAAQQETFSARRAAQAKRIRQYADAVRLATVIRDNMKRRLELIKGREAVYQALADKGAVSQSALADAIQETHRSESELLSAEAALQKERVQHQEAESTFTELILDTREKNLAALTEASAELAQIESQQADNLARLDELTLRAPSAGVIQRIDGGGAGEVLLPGDSLATILPTELELIADIELATKDVGHVSIGDPVVIQITSFDQKRFGKLEGEVEAVSPTTEVNAQDQPFFRVRVKLQSNTIGDGPDTRPLRAGMEVNAEILTSSRTIAEYLLKPVNATLSKAMGER